VHKLIVLPHICWLMFLLGVLAWRSYVLIPDVETLIGSHPEEHLWDIAFQSKWSWWQRRELVRHIASRYCIEGSAGINSVLTAQRIELRTALYQGCFSGSSQSAAWLVSTALSDSGLSFNRLLALEYIERQGLLSRFRHDVARRLQDTSSMVRDKAEKMLQQSPE
jgi:hypothetical protein